MSERNLLSTSRFRSERGRLLQKLSGEQVQEADTLRILSLLIEFQIDDEEGTTGDGRFDLSVPSQPVIDPPPHDREYFLHQLTALANYYRAISYGKLILLSDVVADVFTVPHEMGHYNPGTTDGALEKGWVELLRDAVVSADALGVLFSEYDCVIVFHAGVGGDIDLEYDPTPKDIPSVFLNFKDIKNQLGAGNPDYRGISVQGGQHHVTEGIILPETESQEGYEIGLLGTTAVMFGFQIGLPALWDTETGRSGIGRWGLMDQGSGNYNGLIPAAPCAWSRVFMGWETPVEIRRGLGIEVACSKAKHSSRVYRVPITESEYFLVENRMHDADSDGVTKGRDSAGNEIVFGPDGTLTPAPGGVIVEVEEYDYGLPGSGILIWHVDEKVIEERFASNRINADKNERGVDLEEADGAQDIGESYDMLDGGAGSEVGVLHDAWFGSNAIHQLANGSDQVAFTPDTHPNSRSNSGANSHFIFTDFSESDTVMSFSLKNDFLQNGFPQDFGMGGMPFPPLFGDLNGDGTTEIIVATAEGRIFAWDKNGGAMMTNEATGTRKTVSGETIRFQVALFVDAGQAFSTVPMMADIDGDGWDEVVAATEEGKVFAWKSRDADGDGFADTILAWDEAGEAITAMMFFGGRIFAGTEGGKLFAVGSGGETIWQEDLLGGSIDGLCRYGNDDLIATTGGKEVVALNNTGNVLWRRSSASWEGLMIPASAWDESPTRPVTLTIVSEGMGFFLDGLGAEKARFGERGVSGGLSLPALGDVDGDGFIEAVVTAGGRVWCFNHNGSLSDYFPIPRTERNVSLSSPVLGDVDGDGKTDVVAVSSGGLVEAYRMDGTTAEGFPLAIGGVTAIPPTLLDLDGDGDMEVAAVSDEGILFVYNLSGVTDSNLILWGSFLHDPAHTGMCRQVLVEQEPGVDMMPNRLVYNYPNPTNGDFTTIRYRLERRADIWITVYDLTGERVAAFDAPGEPQTENEVVWRLDGVESGVYLCQVRAVGNDGEKTVMFKIAVVK